MHSALLHGAACAAVTLLFIASVALVARAGDATAAAENAAALARLRRRANAVIAAAERSAVPLDFADELYALASELRNGEVPRA